MRFRLAPKSVTLNDIERRNSPYFVLFHRIEAHCVKVVEDVVVQNSSRSIFIS